MSEKEEEKTPEIPTPEIKLEKIEENPRSGLEGLEKLEKVKKGNNFKKFSILGSKI